MGEVCVCVSECVQLCVLFAIALLLLGKNLELLLFFFFKIHSASKKHFVDKMLYS